MEPNSPDNLPTESRTSMHLSRLFTMLVYPFAHDVEGNQRVPRLRALDDRWAPWWSRVDAEHLPNALDDTQFFLPHVRSLLFPETIALGNLEPGVQVDRIRELGARPAHELAAQVGRDAVLRLTLRPGVMDELRKVTLGFEETICSDFALEWVDVLLFPQRVGLLVLKAALTCDTIPIDGALDFLYYARQIMPPNPGWRMATWRDTGRLELQGRDLVDFLVEGLTRSDLEPAPSLAAFCSGIPESRPQDRYTATDPGQAYGSGFKLFTYGHLAEDPPSGSIPQPLHGDAEQNLFSSPSEQAAYELATVTRTDDPDYVPHPRGLGELMEKGSIALWSNWVGLALSDNVVFLAVRDTNFTQRWLPKNVENDYFPLYLLTVYQKVRLNLLAGDMMRQRPGLHRNAREARNLRAALLRFRNHYWFEEVTSRPQGLEIYRRYRHGMNLISLYQWMDTEVRELQEYYEWKTQRRISAVLTFLTLVAAPAGILTTLFSPALITHASWGDFFRAAVIVYAVIAVAWVVWRLAARD